MSDPRPSSLAASGLSAANLFPGRKTLYVHEVCKVLNISDGHARNLIEEGKLVAVNVAPGGSRRHWRISVAALDSFLVANLS